MKMKRYSNSSQVTKTIYKVLMVMSILEQLNQEYSSKSQGNKSTVVVDKK